ncbi:putative extracellular aldonolactonase protein [Venturia nashicola]|uniref:Putative extracellular aldonolactonase protein n=1 Tax=Venturia nashicola TaxID=86259 RepID=A0A4Z1P0P0_9PEZI|nr:putative extracellular aldonolactonase protein [Venturia nashicola]TLD26035.1 putative extracellular aldonolactonase protein [Venturia nashicola]
MRTISFAAVAATALQAVSAVNLYVAGYDGNLTSLSFDGKALSVISEDHNCGSNPSWLVHDKNTKILYCIDEGNATPNGSVAAYPLSQTGKLTLASHINLTAPGPVSGAIFGDKSFRGMVIAHYSGQVATIGFQTPTSMKVIQQVNFTAISPIGPAGRQSGPHPHQALLDPSGKFILMPDLGADLVRVLCWGPTSNNDTLTEHPPLKAKQGSGPRHAAFWQPQANYNTTDNLYLFLVAELDNTVTAYKVSYPANGGLEFKEVSKTSTFGTATIVPTAAVGEILVSPCNKFLVIGNRLDKSFNNGSDSASDSLATFAIGADAALTFKGLAAAGGISPRHFSFNKAGDKIAVSLYASAKMVILARDVVTGAIGNVIASIPIGIAPDRGAMNTVWDE